MECIVVGAGVVGLAVARALALTGREVVVLESEPHVGSGISSRNSGVIHAGIYYDAGSLKASACVAGKKALYRFCADHGVPHARTGKLVVASRPDQLDALRALIGRAGANGVDDLRYLGPAAARELEPALECAGALLSPSTGIVDVHAYMLALQGDAESHGAAVVLQTPFLRAEATADGLVVTTGGEEGMRLGCHALINCGGLFAQQIARNIKELQDIFIPKLHLSKGNYFALRGRSPFRHLIYPMPDGAWLGVHVTLDLAGRCRFGPDLHWVDRLDYDVDEHLAADFYAAIRRWWPDLPDDSLSPDYTGIRPKLYARGEPARDFVIQGPETHGVPGLVNLFGIESPGLTSSLAIGERVRALVGAAQC